MRERTAAGVVVLLAIAGCGKSGPPAGTTTASLAPVAAAPATQPASAPSVTTAVETVAKIVEESLEWSADEALANLEDAELGLSAAVRLVRLSEIDADFLPDPLPAEAVARLRLAALGDFAFALGLRDETNPRVIRHPLLIDSAGAVARPGDEDEQFDLHVSANGRVFPHLLIGPMKVASASQPKELYFTLAKPPTLRFEVRQNNGYDYLALVRPAGLPPQVEETSAGAGPAEEGAGEAVVGERHAANAAAPADDGAVPAETAAPDPRGRAVSQPASGATAGSDPNVARTSVVEDVEIARYTWDPFELLFMGPASDSFPEPLKGRFEIDLKGSTWLLPVGGDVGRPDPLRKTDMPPGDS